VTPRFWVVSSIGSIDTGTAMTKPDPSAFIRGLVCGSCLVGLFSPVAASDWPRFRGPNGAGISADTGVPVEFGEKKNLHWKVEIPGAGNSSPIVSKQRIFLQTASDNGRERQLLCLDLASGNTLWSRTAPGGVVKTHLKNTMASSTAAADGLRVYVSFWDGRGLAVAAYDYGGKPLWSRDLGTFVSQHGAGHSPIVVGSKVIFAKDQDGSAEVVALDSASGEIAWKAERPAHRACYSTPFLLEQPGADPELLVTSTFGVTAYDPASGSELWKWDWVTNDRRLRTVGSAIVSGQGQLFLCSGDGKGDRQTAAVTLGRNGHASAIDWELRKAHLPYVPCVLARGEFLFYVNDFGLAACVVAKTGEHVWQNRLDGGDVTASPVMVEDRIYSVSESGAVSVFAAEPAFKLLASTELDEGVKASPAVAEGRLLIRGAKHLYCFGQTGK
jgi:outer membrane protein assembly factor BamB